MTNYTKHYIARECILPHSKIKKWIIKEQVWNNKHFNGFTGEYENQLISNSWINTYYNRYDAEESLKNTYEILKSRLKEGEEIVMAKTQKMTVVTIHYN